ncbi:hypothetical protein C8R46DRAFT_1027676 [Mycena filopes]|nr:hypothetical protein C8R46DRAFT_1027676 [Mycena filopes]
MLGSLSWELYCGTPTKVLFLRATASWHMNLLQEAVWGQMLYVGTQWMTPEQEQDVLREVCRGPTPNSFQEVLSQSSQREIFATSNAPSPRWPCHNMHAQPSSSQPRQSQGSQKSPVCGETEQHGAHGCVILPRPRVFVPPPRPSNGMAETSPPPSPPRSRSASPPSLRVRFPQLFDFEAAGEANSDTSEETSCDVSSLTNWDLGGIEGDGDSTDSDFDLEDWEAL